MGDKRKLQAEIERTLKRVQEGVDQFDEIFGKVQTAANSNQKEKYEGELKKEIKKLQRMRDQIKAWATSNDVKDKKPLQEARKKIEAQMEKFKVIERETKAKPFSKEGLGMAAKVDPLQREQEELNDWLIEIISRLNVQVDQFDSEIDCLFLGSKKKKLDRDKQETVDDLTFRKDKHKFHIQALETILRRLCNHSINLEKIHSIQQNVEYYVDCCREVDFVEMEEIYDELQLSVDDAQALQLGNVFPDDETSAFQPTPISAVLPPMSPSSKTTGKEELQWKIDISPNTDSHSSPRKLSTSRGSTSSTSALPTQPSKITGKSILAPAKSNPPLTKSQSNPGPAPSPSSSLVAPPSRLSTTSSKAGPSPPIGYASVAGSGLQTISANNPSHQTQPQPPLLQTQAHSHSQHSSTVPSSHPAPSHPIPIPYSTSLSTSDVTSKDLGYASGASSVPKTQPMSLAQQAARAAQLPSSVPISSTKVPQRTPPSSLSIPLHQASVPQQATLKSSLPFQQVPLGSTPSHETPTSLPQYAKQLQPNLTPLESTCYPQSHTWNHSGFSTPMQPNQTPFPLPTPDVFNSGMQPPLEIGREESTSDGLFFTPLTEPPSRFELLSKDSSMNAAFSVPGPFPGSVLPHIPSTAQPAGQHTYPERSILPPTQQMLPSTEGITDMSNPDVNDPDSPSSLKQMASKVLKSAGLSHPAPPSSQTQMKLEPIKEARENLPSYSEEVEERPSSILSQQSESASHKTGHNTPDIMPDAKMKIENKSNEDLRHTGTSPNNESDETILTPLLGVSPLGSVIITQEMSTQTYMLEACSRHIPQLADSERVRQYTQRSPVPSAPYHHSQPPTFFCSHDFFNRLSTETLFFIFYYQEGTKAQYLAAKALKKQSWRFHTKYMMWFQRHDDPKKITDEYELGTYIYFDYEKWTQKRKEGFMFEYKFLEDKELN